MESQPQQPEDNDLGIDLTNFSDEQSENTEPESPVEAKFEEPKPFNYAGLIKWILASTFFITLIGIIFYMYMNSSKGAEVKPLPGYKINTDGPPKLEKIQK